MEKLDGFYKGNSLKNVCRVSNSIFVSLHALRNK